MPLDVLLAELRRSAETEAAKLLAAANAEADRISSTATAEAAGRRDAALRDLDARELDATTRQLGEARLAATQLVLRARTRLIDRVLGAAADRGATWTMRPEDLDAMGERIGAALSCAEETAAELRCSPSLEAVARRAAAARGDVAVRADPSIAAGFFLATSDGHLTIDQSISARIAARRPGLAQLIVHHVDAPA